MPSTADLESRFAQSATLQFHRPPETAPGSGESRAGQGGRTQLAASEDDGSSDMERSSCACAAPPFYGTARRNATQTGCARSAPVAELTNSPTAMVTTQPITLNHRERDAGERVGVSDGRQPGEHAHEGAVPVGLPRSERPGRRRPASTRRIGSRRC